MKPENDAVGAVARYVIKGLDVAKTAFLKEDAEEKTQIMFQFLEAVEKAKVSKDPEVVIELIKTHGLVREHIPVGLLNDINILATTTAEDAHDSDDPKPG